MNIFFSHACMRLIIIHSFMFKVWRCTIYDYWSCLCIRHTFDKHVRSCWSRRNPIRRECFVRCIKREQKMCHLKYCHFIRVSNRTSGKSRLCKKTPLTRFWKDLRRNIRFFEKVNYIKKKLPLVSRIYTVVQKIFMPRFLRLVSVGTS